jgi:hypothetical protein
MPSSAAVPSMRARAKEMAAAARRTWNERGVG